MNGKMRIKIGIIILLVGLVAIVVFVPDRSNRLVNEKRLEEINSYDLENDYPQTPFAVISINNNILSFLYSGNITENLVEPIVKKQRQLFHADFLALNDETEYIDTIKAEIMDLRDRNFKLISVTQEPPIYNQNNADICSINVIQFTNAKGKPNLNTTYFLQRDDEGKWKILGFLPTEEETSSNE